MVTQEESSVFLEAIVSVIMKKKKLYINLCWILYGYWGIEMFESPDLIPLDFFFAILDEKRSWDK
jgi:hypothetical protein